MKKYLLDTNICIYFMKGMYDLDRKIKEAGEQNCFLSEITVAELKYGVENSKKPEELRAIIDAFIPKFSIIPIYNSLDVYAREKAKLRKQGLMIDDFDILIGATSIINEMILVTKNISHFSRLDNLIIEDWTVSLK